MSLEGIVMIPLHIVEKFKRNLAPTRTNLKALTKPLVREKYNLFQTYMELLYREVVNTATSGETKYILTGLFSSKFAGFGTYPHSKLTQQDEICLELVELIKQEYADCTVEYHETKGYEGKIIERIVSIDWS